MLDLDIAPMLSEIFGDEPAMTMIGPILAAQQASPVERLPIDRAVDSSFLDQPQERLFINAPIPILHFVCGKELLRRSEQRNMNIINITDFFDEIRQIGLFGEARKLRYVVQPNVDERFNLRLLERGEERFGRFFRETDRKDLHLDRPRATSMRFKPNA